MPRNKGKSSLRGVFINGILNENPTFRLVLGTCPTMAVSTTAINGIGMGLAATFVLIGSNVVISMLRKFIPDKVRIPAFVVVICTFVTMTELFMHAYLPSLFSALGIFLPLIVVNCIILARAEAYASKNGVLASAVDGVGMGIGFTIGITLIGIIREVLSNGSAFGMDLMGKSFEPMLIFGMAPGGFIIFGLTLGIINAISSHDWHRKSIGKEKKV
jgi:Na+-translocating ferredoxin:NAD+ oxidoreductase subunit E